MILISTGTTLVCQQTQTGYRRIVFVIIVVKPVTLDERPTMLAKTLSSTPTLQIYFGTSVLRDKF